MDERVDDMLQEALRAAVTHGVLAPCPECADDGQELVPVKTRDGRRVCMWCKTEVVEQ
jgi:hypothetical protein